MLEKQYNNLFKKLTNIQRSTTEICYKVCKYIFDNQQNA